MVRYDLMLEGCRKGCKTMREQKLKRIEKYNKNPNICKRIECNNIIQYKDKHRQIFCSRSCSTSFNNNSRPKKLKQCTNCKKQTYMKKYCSQICYIDFKFKKNKELYYNGLLVNPPKLRNTMIKIFGRKCWMCKLDKWMNKELPINVDHIDGHSENNDPKNLRLLCLNCHGQTPTFGSKNMGNGRKNRRKTVVGFAPT